MSSIRLKILVAQIVSFCLVGELNYEKILKIANDNSEGFSDIKGAVAAVHFIITNAAKYDVEDRVLIQEIQQLGLPKENSDTISKQYRENKDALRDQLVQDSYRLSKLVEVKWRVDQIMATSSSSSTGASSSDSNNNKLLHIQVKVDTKPQLTKKGKEKTTIEDGIQEIAMEMTPDYLDLLVHELSQAQQMMNELDT